MINRIKMWLFRRRYKRWSAEIKPKKKLSGKTYSYQDIDPMRQQQLMELLQGLNSGNQVLDAQRWQIQAGLVGNILGGNIGFLFGNRYGNYA